MPWLVGNTPGSLEDAEWTCSLDCRAGICQALSFSSDEASHDAASLFHPRSLAGTE